MWVQTLMFLHVPLFAGHVCPHRPTRDSVEVPLFRGTLLRLQTVHNLVDVLMSDNVRQCQTFHMLRHCLANVQGDPVNLHSRVLFAQLESLVYYINIYNMLFT